VSSTANSLLHHSTSAISKARIIRIEDIAPTVAGSMLNNYAYVIWSSVALNAGVLCACLPVMPPLLRKIFRRGITQSQGTTVHTSPGQRIQARKPLFRLNSVYLLEENAGEPFPVSSSVQTRGSSFGHGNGSIPLRDFDG